MAGQPGKFPMKIFISTPLAILIAVLVLAVGGRIEAGDSPGSPPPTTTIEKKSINLDGAKKAIAAAVDYAKKNNAPGGVIAVVDEGGNLMALERLDGTFAMGATISIGKARTAVLFKKPTRFFEELINKGRTAMTAVDGFTPLIGGIPIVIDGQIVGGIGVSGAASANQDEELALTGANAVAGRAETGMHEGSSKEFCRRQRPRLQLQLSSTPRPFLRHLPRACPCSKPPVTRCTPVAASNPVRRRSTRSTQTLFTSSMGRPRW